MQPVRHSCLSRASIYNGSNYLYLPEPLSFTFTPASREPTYFAKPSFAFNALPAAFSLGRVRPARLVVRCPWHSTYPAIDALRSAFLSGAVIQARVALRDPLFPSVLNAQVTDFHASALGTFFTLLILDL